MRALRASLRLLLPLVVAPSAPGLAYVFRGAQEAVQSLESSREKVEQGVHLASQAGQAILEIQKGAQRVVDAIRQFSSTLER